MILRYAFRRKPRLSAEWKLCPPGRRTPPIAMPSHRRFRLTGQLTGQPDGGADAQRSRSAASVARRPTQSGGWGASPMQAAACWGSRRKTRPIASASERAECCGGGKAPAPPTRNAGGQVRYHTAQRQGPGRRPGGRAQREGDAPTQTQTKQREPVSGSLERHLPARAAAPAGGGQRPGGRHRGRSPLEPRRGVKAKGGQERSDPAPRSPVLKRSDVGRRTFLHPFLRRIEARIRKGFRKSKLAAAR